MNDLKKFSEFIYNTNDKNYEKQCENLWEINPNICMKCIMFILDQRKDEDIFIKCMIWIYKNHKTTFDKNLSLIVGLPNKKLITDEELTEIAKDDYETHENILKEFISEEYRNTFRKEFLSRIYNHYFKEIYKIPVYGTPELLKKIQKVIIKINPKDLVTKYKITSLCERFKLMTTLKYKTFDEQYLWVRC